MHAELIRDLVAEAMCVAGMHGRMSRDRYRFVMGVKRYAEWFGNLALAEAEDFADAAAEADQALMLARVVGVAIRDGRKAA